MKQQQPTPETIQRYHVFLASPGDVRAHRDFVRGFFADYNIQHAAAKQVEFQVVDWENWSTLGVGETQKLITRQLLDQHRHSFALVIGILGQRFGTPTSTHESGTEEEFDWALDCWKAQGHPEIKWFFLDPDEITIPAEKRERNKVLEQWDKVCAFRERLQKGDVKQGDPSNSPSSERGCARSVSRSQPGTSGRAADTPSSHAFSERAPGQNENCLGDPPLYCGTFEDLESFKETFRRDLNLWLGAAERPWNVPPEPPQRPARTRKKASSRKRATPRTPTPASSDLLSAYLNRLREDTGKIALIGLGQDLQVELDILEAYVPLRTVAFRRLTPDECERRSRSSLPVGLRHEMEEPLIEVNQLFQRAADFGERGAVLLGDPGAGKTTVARQLVFSLASGRVPPAKLGLPAGVAPVFLRFRNFETADAASGFNAFLEREVAPCYEDAPARRRAVRTALLDRPCLLWVLDGLDEVVDEGLRAKARDWVGRLLKDRPGDRFLVTSRFQGYRGKAELGGRFVEFHVQPLEMEQSRTFVRRWYEEVCRKLRGRGSRAVKEAEELIASLNDMLDGPVFQIGRMAELPANPLLLTILCVVHHQDRNLPRRRADLYARCVRVLLEHWRMEVWQKQGAQAFDAVSAERVLADLAWRMHQKQGLIAMDAGEMARAAEPTLRKMPEGAGLGRDGAEFLKRMRDRCGVMAMVGEGRTAFLHLTFQEYLSALHAESHSLAAALAKSLGETWWREPTLLAMAIGRPEFTAAFFEAVLQGAAWKDHADLLGQCLDEARNPELAPFAQRLSDPDFAGENRLRLLRMLAARELPELAEAAERLAGVETGEARSLALQLARKTVKTGEPVMAEPGAVWVDERTGLEFVWIPPGEFQMGSKSISSDERPVHLVRVTKGFWLGRYTVTNRDYGKFLEKAKHAKPEYWNRREYNAEQQPVVGVSWEDARAYCQWAGCRLPTEAQWEYACRAGSTTAFCFGDDDGQLTEYAWFSQNSGGATHPVGQKQPNAWGIYDMHGNVWEWCQDWYGDYPEGAVTDPKGPTTGSYRVFRGGGWFNPAEGCRSAFRNWFVPSYRLNGVGFRVVLARSSVPGQVPERQG